MVSKAKNLKQTQQNINSNSGDGYISFLKIYHYTFLNVEIFHSLFFNVEIMPGDKMARRIFYL